MIAKKPSPARTSLSTAKPWGELAYLCQRIRYWLYTRKQKARAERYADRLQKTLSNLPDNDLAIIREDGLALLSELRGKMNEAITHRKREIQLMERLQREADSPGYAASTRSYMLRGRGKSVLEKRRALLGALVKTQSENRHLLIRKAQ